MEINAHSPRRVARSTLRPTDIDLSAVDPGAGRRQRRTPLAHLGRCCASSDCHRAASLCFQSDRCRVGSEPLRAGLDRRRAKAIRSCSYFLPNPTGPQSYPLRDAPVLLALQQIDSQNDPPCPANPLKLSAYSRTAVCMHNGPTLAKATERALRKGRIRVTLALALSDLDVSGGLPHQRQVRLAQISPKPLQRLSVSLPPGDFALDC